MLCDRIKQFTETLNGNTAALITNQANRFYLTGFMSDAGALLLLRNCAYLLVDFRYFEKARKTVTNCSVLQCGRLYDDVKKLLEEHGITKLLLETDDITVQNFKFISCMLGNINVSDDDAVCRTLKEMRAVKDANELDCIKQAQKLTDETFKYILPRISAGLTEKEIMLDMEFFMRARGSEGVSFDFIVVSGKNSSLPHGVPTDKKIEKGDFVTMDFGAVVNGYHSDMTRTVAVGNVSDEQLNVYNTVLKAQEAAILKIKSGMICSDIDKIARDIINTAGYEGCFGHSLGHSVGVEIHEQPVLSPSCDKPLTAGNVVTVEPGIYIENKFGVRIEDMVCVTDDGCENLTHSPKNLIII